MKVHALVRLYPRAWRERYGEEFVELVASRKAGPRVILDILIGALDAWLAPQPQVSRTAAGASAGGRVMAILRAGCGTSAASPREQIRLAALAAGATLGYVLVWVWLKHAVGPSPWIEALGGSAGSVAPIMYMLVLLRPHSLRARLVLCGGVLAAVYAIGLLAAWM